MSCIHSHKKIHDINLLSIVLQDIIVYLILHNSDNNTYYIIINYKMLTNTLLYIVKHNGYVFILCLITDYNIY